MAQLVDVKFAEETGELVEIIKFRKCFQAGSSCLEFRWEAPTVLTFDARWCMTRTSRRFTAEFRAESLARAFAPPKCQLK